MRSISVRFGLRALMRGNSKRIGDTPYGSMVQVKIRYRLSQAARLKTNARRYPDSIMSELIVEKRTDMGQSQDRQQEHARDDYGNPPIEPAQDTASQGLFGQSQRRLEASEDLIRIGHGKGRDPDAHEQQAHRSRGRRKVIRRQDGGPQFPRPEPFRQR